MKDCALEIVYYLQMKRSGEVEKVGGSPRRIESTHHLLSNICSCSYFATQKRDSEKRSRHAGQCTAELQPR